MSGKLRLNGGTSGYSELQAPAVAGDQTFTFPAAGGTLMVSGGNVDLWTRTGTTLKPVNDGDAVEVDGSITAAGDVKSGERDPSATDTRGVRIAVDSQNGGVYAQAKGSAAASSYMAFQALHGTTEKFKVMYDGTSSFAGNSRFGPATGGGKVNIEGMGTTAGELSIANPTGSNSFNCFRVISQGANKVVITQGGTISATNTTIQPVSSERRLKENIVTVDAATSWSTIKDTPYYAYNFIGNESITYGPMADEVPAEMKVATDQTDDVGVIHTFDNGMMQARLYTALQTALTRIETLEATNTALEARLTALEGGAS